MGDRVIRLAIAAAVSIGLGVTLLPPAASAQSLSDRFKSLFGGGSSDSKPATPAAPPALNENDAELTCPPVQIRSGASTYAVAAPGKQPIGNDIKFLASISRMARQCSLDNGQITAKIGIQGRVIVGPSGAPPTVEVPLRVAVVQGGVGEKTIMTKAYTTTVQIDETGSVPFSLVAEDVVYPAPSPADNDNYVFYIGFDPQALKPEPKPRGHKKR
ncbi:MULTISPECIES: hypothetical protein [unclassified Bradyrhizobium]|uniref:hypothetical protein n=1 Tax=unclassified Bradyrhizobium TaxID=2631580 RepID=UPI00247940CD|nr:MULTISPECIES: hypothetical protein [unclassified Bradyrhizobium]WGS21676.1 hypothetical protein MTX22_08225 [Bradyrhizobium sp. ISRA463]WGS28623.1 hypothetical protein MTX19_06055 [Bradyrhizobium sp. ISRA464]